VRAAFEVNAIGAMLGIRAVVPSMRAAGGGSIVNISSIAGMQGVRGMSAYTMSKFALRGLSRSAAGELGHAGIRVNSVHPGPIHTDMVAAFYDPDSLQDRPVPRYGRADEVAKVVLFLASDESSFVTGAEYVVDGGALAGI
jgi:3alpha(or 20beta)-hydroxysteroid dehydrogenase